jgi:hypothetical protein
VRWIVLFAPALLLAQEQDFRVELTASAWNAAIEGSVQSGGLPIALHADLNLADQWTFFGKLVLKPARRHRIVIEGSPYEFTGLNTLSRTIMYSGRTYSFNDTIASDASLAYFFAGYQFDIVSRGRGHVGLEAGGAYFDATGTITSTTTGISATHNQILGLPLAGAEFRANLGPAHLNVNGEAKGMSFGGFGDYFQGDVNVGAGFRRLMFQAGYRYVNADIHENRATNPAGIAPVIRGPIFSIQLRDR